MLPPGRAKFETKRCPTGENIDKRDRYGVGRLLQGGHHRRGMGEDHSRLADPQHFGGGRPLLARLLKFACLAPKLFLQIGYGRTYSAHRRLTRCRASALPSCGVRGFAGLRLIMRRRLIQPSPGPMTLPYHIMGSVVHYSGAADGSNGSAADCSAADRSALFVGFTATMAEATSRARALRCRHRTCY